MKHEKPMEMWKYASFFLYTLLSRSNLTSIDHVPVRLRRIDLVDYEPGAQAELMTTDGRCMDHTTYDQHQQSGSLSVSS